MQSYSGTYSGSYQEPKGDSYSQREQNILNTPISKSKSAFKSPAPSNKKNHSGFKSPNMLSIQSMLGGYNGRSGNSFMDSWFTSPVNSRLRDHIDILNNFNEKDRLFQSSPLVNQHAWPLSSPSMEKRKSEQQYSTAPNTATGQKYMTMGSMEGYNDIKAAQSFIDSPEQSNRKHQESSEMHLQGSSQGKNFEKSEFKSMYPQSSFKQVQVIIPYSYQEESLNTPPKGLRSHHLHYSQQNREERAPTQSSQQQRHSVKSQIYSDQYSNSNEESIDNSHSNSNNLDKQYQSQKSHNHNRKHSRSYILDENGILQRVIRKRKRKSGDQLKYLMREFDKNPGWTKETVLEVSRKTGLSEAQVYKWGWDQKKKRFGPDAAGDCMPLDDEMESDLEFEQVQMQSSQQQKQGRFLGNSQFALPDQAHLDQMTNQLKREEFNNNQKDKNLITKKKQSENMHDFRNSKQHIPETMIERRYEYSEVYSQQVYGHRDHLLAKDTDKKRAIKGQNKENQAVGRYQKHVTVSESKHVMITENHNSKVRQSDFEHKKASDHQKHKNAKVDLRKK